jgi:hypothetical protein
MRFPWKARSRMLTMDDEAPLPHGGPSRARLLLLLGVWGTVCALTRWLAWDLQSAEPRFVLAGLFVILPITLPLSLVILRGVWIVPWLALGAMILGVLAAHYRYTEFQRTTFSSPEGWWLLLTVLGLGASWCGCWAASVMALREGRVLSVCGWVVMAVIATFALVVLLTILRA